MPLLAGLVLLIQFSFAFHALRTGRPYWWMFVIMAFPVMGSVMYYFIEVFPGSREHRSANRTARKLARALKPDADLKRRAEELEICGSVDNRVALAQECMNHQMFAEAAKLYESCLAGAFAHDGQILFGLLRARVEQQDWDRAGLLVERLRSQAPEVRPMEVRLLDARILAGRGETAAAQAAFRDLIPQFSGLEARYRYGDFLAGIGQHDAARQAFQDLLTHSKRFASTVEDEQDWVRAARQAVRG
jgi:hypothetical protein